MFKKILNGLRPKGFWGYFGVAYLLISAVCAAVYLTGYSPYAVVPVSDLQFLVGTYLSLQQDFLTLLNQCNVI